MYVYCSAQSHQINYCTYKSNKADSNFLAGATTLRSCDWRSEFNHHTSSEEEEQRAFKTLSHTQRRGFVGENGNSPSVLMSVWDHMLRHLTVSDVGEIWVCLIPKRTPLLVFKTTVASVHVHVLRFCSSDMRLTAAAAPCYCKNKKWNQLELQHKLLAAKLCCIRAPQRGSAEMSCGSLRH